MAKEKAAPAGAPAWMVTFADLMSLLVCFFVLIISFSIQDEQKLQVVAGSVRDAFGVRRDWQARALIEIDGRPKTRNVMQSPNHNIVVYMPRPDRTPPEDAERDDESDEPREDVGPKDESAVTREQELLASAADFLESSDYTGDSLHAQIGDPGSDGGDGEPGAGAAGEDWRAQLEPVRPIQPESSEAKPSEADDRELTEPPPDWRGQLEAEREEEKKAQEEKRVAATEEKFVEEVKERLEDLKEARPEIAEFVENLKVERAERGVRIELVDDIDKPMFNLGSAKLDASLKPLMNEVATLVAGTENRLLITGHTDGRPYRGRRNYDNWNLSSDRAHATRRALIAAGVPAAKIAGVLGKGDSEHAIAAAPNDPRNRRIGILLLRKGDNGA